MLCETNNIPWNIFISFLKLHELQINVQGEPWFSVMAAGWFCEESGWSGKVEDVKLVP